MRRLMLERHEQQTLAGLCILERNSAGKSRFRVCSNTTHAARHKFFVVEFEKRCKRCRRKADIAIGHGIAPDLWQGHNSSFGGTMRPETCAVADAVAIAKRKPT